MRKLTDNQKEFLLNTFFKNEKFAGWKEIAAKLLENGKCIVAGQDNIWIGGIGNFVDVSNLADAYDCSVYSFDLERFFSSAYYKEAIRLNLADLKVKRDKADELYIDIYNINRY